VRQIQLISDKLSKTKKNTKENASLNDNIKTPQSILNFPTHLAVSTLINDEFNISLCIMFSV